MDSKEIVRRLVIGSDAVDRMRREINSVVGTVLGLVQKAHEVHTWMGEFSLREDLRERFFSPEFPGVEWRLTAYSSLRSFEVTCWLNVGFGVAEVYAENSKTHRNVTISHRDAQRVHESLSLFVDGMRKMFPVLEDYYWQSFLDAAYYAEKNGW